MAKTTTTTQPKTLEGRFGKQIPRAIPTPPQPTNTNKNKNSNTK